MESKLIFYPIIGQVLLTLGMYIKLTIVKNQALSNDEVDLKRRALHGDAWPDSVLKVSNNLQNQFESPVLFYILCFVLWALNAVDMLALVITSAYVLLRVVHGVVHTGSNTVAVRKKVFMVSVILLMALCALCLKSLLI